MLVWGWCLFFTIRNPEIFCPSDEDMQSLASLMSMKQADIGNLDDFEEENEEDEENRVNQEEKAAKITGKNQEKNSKCLFFFGGPFKVFRVFQLKQLKYLINNVKMPSP